MKIFGLGTFGLFSQIKTIIRLKYIKTINYGTKSRKYMGRAKRIWYLSPMRAAKVQASLRIRAVSPEPSLLAHTSSESRGTFRQKARSLAPLNGWACAVEICHDRMLEDTNSLGAAHILNEIYRDIKLIITSNKEYIDRGLSPVRIEPRHRKKRTTEAQTSLRIHCLDSIITILAKSKLISRLVSFRSGVTVSYLVAKPEDRFSHDVTANFEPRNNKTKSTCSYSDDSEHCVCT